MMNEYHLSCTDITLTQIIWERDDGKEGGGNLHIIFCVNSLQIEKKKTSKC